MNTMKTFRSDGIMRTARTAADRLITREVRHFKSNVTWYDLTCFGLLITSVVAISAGLLG